VTERQWAIFGLSTIIDMLPDGLKVQEEEVFACEPVAVEFGFNVLAPVNVQRALEGVYGAGNVQVQ
jgi:hypothetical protein